MREYKVVFYKSENGRIPFQVWFETLDPLNQKRVEARINRVSLGNLGDYKELNNELFELRLFFGSGYRIYFSIVEDQMLLILAGGDKDSQKKDILASKFYLNSFLLYKNEKRN